ncbi:MAG: patatin-like phospholipase family protein [Desulfomonile tiedjei]|uniref:Patatin-like phospholipase family protein n=1 Tax=Desulfomonile tiedjei TaxID=2358 RepID=A0A9D6Z109_9BACT|nr:patatin-like phospholipase family protein [Desulfomonile tiedjei]
MSLVSLSNMKKTSHNLPHELEATQNSIGLALSAGGARGAYQIGSWRALRERGLSLGAVAGSSIGALNGALVCQGDWESAYDLWIQLTRSTVLRPDYGKIGKLVFTAAVDIGLLFVPVPNLRFVRILKYASSVIKIASRHGSLGMLRRMGLFNLSDLKPLLGKYIEISKVLDGKIPLFVTTCGPPCQTDPLGPLRYFRLQEHDEENAWRILSASMSIPFVFGGVRINGETFSDGGIRESLPVDPLYEIGFRKIVAVGMKRDMHWRPEKYPDSTIVLITPDQSLGRFPLATFRFTREAVLEWMSRGYLDAHRILDKQRLIF